MPIVYHPPRGTVVAVSYEKGFVEPEMTKTRLAIVLSPAIKARVKLVTIVPLSLTAPETILPFHKQIDIPFMIPKPWGNQPRWIKGDMVNAVGFHRVDLLRLGKDREGQRIYQKAVLGDRDFAIVKQCVLHGLGLSNLTKYVK